MIDDSDHTALLGIGNNFSYFFLDTFKEIDVFFFIISGSLRIRKSELDDLRGNCSLSLTLSLNLRKFSLNWFVITSSGDQCMKLFVIVKETVVDQGCKIESIISLIEVNSENELFIIIDLEGSS